MSDQNGNSLVSCLLGSLRYEEPILSLDKVELGYSQIVLGLLKGCPSLFQIGINCLGVVLRDSNIAESNLEVGISRIIILVG